MIFFFFSIETIITPRLCVPPVSHLTCCTPTKSNLYTLNSQATVLTEPDLFRLLTLHVPNLITIFHCLGCPKGSAKDQGTFHNQTSFRWRVLNNTPKAQAIRLLLVSFSRLHIHIFAASLHIGGRSSIHKLRTPMYRWQGPTYQGTKLKHLCVFLYSGVCLVLSESSGNTAVVGVSCADDSIDFGLFQVSVPPNGSWVRNQPRREL